MCVSLGLKKSGDFIVSKGHGQGRAARQGAGQGPFIRLSCRAGHGRAGHGPNKE